MTSDHLRSSQARPTWAWWPWWLGGLGRVARLARVEPAPLSSAFVIFRPVRSEDGRRCRNLSLRERPAMNAAIGVSNVLLRSSLSLPHQASASKLLSLRAPKAWICDQCYKRTFSSRKSSACASYPAIGRTRKGSRQDRFPSVGRPRSRPYSTRDDDGLDRARKELPSHEESRQSLFYKRFSSMMDHAQSNIFIAGQRLNDLTGYSGIEALKKDIEEQGTKIYRLLPLECTHNNQSSP